MNTLLLLAGLRPWRAPSWTSLLTRVFLVIGVLSVEMQIATRLHVGSIRTLPIVNAGLAVLAFITWRPPEGPRASTTGLRWPVPAAAALLMAALVTALDVGRPLQAADTYHLVKIDRIAELGTLDYDTRLGTKTNILSSAYEMVLADLRLVPGVGPALLRLHGLLGLLLYLVGIGAVRELLDAPPGWPWAVLLTVPVVFHQFVLVKNDLFVAVPAWVVLTWIVARCRTAPVRDVVWASWLVTFVVAVKLTSLSLLAVLAAAVLIERRDRGRSIAGVALGVLFGVVAGGFLFTLTENAEVYGVLMPVGDIGGGTAGAGDIWLAVRRFAISLFDLGILTRHWWPGRGGWGSTFGLPLIWSLAVLASRGLRVPEVRRGLLVAGFSFLVFAVAFIDADIAVRLVLAPGLLLVALAVHLIADDRHSAGWATPMLRVVALLSTAQIVRSAFLYFVRP